MELDSSGDRLDRASSCRWLESQTLIYPRTEERLRENIFLLRKVVIQSTMRVNGDLLVGFVGIQVVSSMAGWLLVVVMISM